MRISAIVRWTGLALLGILVAAAVAIGASRLASQQIGLDSQPISAGDALAPAEKTGPPPRHPSRPEAGKPRTGNRGSTGTPAAPEPTPPPVYSAPTTPAPAAHPDDSSGGGEDLGSRGADD